MVEIIKSRHLLQAGSTGEDVSYLQKRLNHMRIALALAFDTLNTDGIFGERTREAVRAFQAARKLTVDGIVGEKTWTALSVSYGDVNSDGKLNAADAMQILQATVGKRTFTAAQKKAADMNADGKTDAADAQQILRRAVDKE